MTLSPSPGAPTSSAAVVPSPGDLPVERIVLGAKLRAFANGLGEARREAVIRTSVISLIMLVFWIAGFGLLYRGLAYVDGVADFGRVLTVRAFYTFFLALTYMLAFSNVLVAFAVLFRAPDRELLLALPVDPRRLFRARFVEALVQSSWALLFVSIPVVVSFGLVRHAGPTYYVASALLIPPFIIIPAAAGAAVALVLGLIFSRLTTIQALLLLGVPFVALAVFAATRFELGDGSGESVEGALRQLASGLALAQWPLLPSSWVARGVLRSSDGEIREGAYHLLLLVVNALMAGVALDWLAGRLYHRALLAQTSRGIPRGETGVSPAGVIAGRGTAPAAARARPILAKDLRLFARDPVQWGQLLLLVLLLAIYLGSLWRMPRHFASAFWVELTIALNRSTVVLILAILTSRFAFPLLSLEGPALWLIGSSPFRRARVIGEKLRLSFVATAALGLALAVVSDRLLAVPWPQVALDAIAAVAVAGGLSGLAIAFGAVYPEFQEPNPARIINGLGGTLNFFASVFLILVAAGLEAIPFGLRAAGASPGAVFGAHAAKTAVLVLISAACAGTCYGIARRSLERREM